MRISCEVIRDLLPLYVEDIASKDTGSMVEEHVKSCSDCRKELKEMRKQPENNLPIDTYTKPLKKIKSTLFKKKVRTIILTVMVTITIAAILIANLTTPNYIPYSSDVLNITEQSDGIVVMEFRDDVSGYDLERYQIDDKGGYVFHVTTWTTYFSRNIANIPARNVVLNPDGEKVSSVYYYQVDGGSDILIYGRDQNPGGGIVTLPRLVLGYYLVLALGFLIISALLLLLLYRNKRVRYWMIRIVGIPASYIIAHFCIRGSRSASYTALRDFIAVLAIAIPLYIVFLLVLALIGYYRRKTTKT